MANLTAEQYDTLQEMLKLITEARQTSERLSESWAKGLANPIGPHTTHLSSPITPMTPSQSPQPPDPPDLVLVDPGAAKMVDTITQSLIDVNKQLQKQSEESAAWRAEIDEQFMDIKNVRADPLPRESSVTLISYPTPTKPPQPPDPPDFNQFGQRLSKFEFPKFDGTLLREWFRRCEEFFYLHKTPPEMRVRVASSYMIGKALQWHTGYIRSNFGIFPPWLDYIMAISAKFGDDDAIPMHPVPFNPYYKNPYATPLLPAIQPRAPFSPYQNQNNQSHDNSPNTTSLLPPLETTKTLPYKPDSPTETNMEKSPRKLCCEEIQESGMRGLCISSDGSYANDHHLESKKSQIFVVECDDEESCDDGKPSEVIVEEITDKSVDMIREEKSTPENESSPEVSPQILLSQFQVSLSSLEPGRRYHKESLVVVNDLSSDLGCVIDKTNGCICDSELGQANSHDEEEFKGLNLGKVLKIERLLSIVCLLGLNDMSCWTQLLRQQIFPKSWRFKFKTESSGEAILLNTYRAVCLGVYNRNLETDLVIYLFEYKNQMLLLGYHGLEVQVLSGLQEFGEGSKMDTHIVICWKKLASFLWFLHGKKLLDAGQKMQSMLVYDEEKNGLRNTGAGNKKEKYSFSGNIKLIKQSLSGDNKLIKTQFSSLVKASEMSLLGRDKWKWSEKQKMYNKAWKFKYIQRLMLNVLLQTKQHKLLQGRTIKCKMKKKEVLRRIKQSLFIEVQLHMKNNSEFNFQANTRVLELIKDRASRKKKLYKDWWFKYKLNTWFSEALHFWRKRKYEKLQRASEDMMCELIYKIRKACHCVVRETSQTTSHVWYGWKTKAEIMRTVSIPIMHLKGKEETFSYNIAGTSCSRFCSFSHSSWMVSHNKYDLSSCVLRREKNYVMVLFPIGEALTLVNDLHTLVAQKKGTETSTGCCYGSHADLDLMADVTAGTTDISMDEFSSVCKLLFGVFVLNLIADQVRDWSFFGLLLQWKWHPPPQATSEFNQALTNQSFIFEDKDALKEGVLLQDN